MKFGHTLMETSSKLVSHLSGDGVKRAAFVLYKDLKKQLKSTTHEHGQEVERRKVTALEDHDECAVCLEPFNTLSAGFRTACGHTFHPVCFVDAVTEGPCKCPLCRRPLQETLPSGVDSFTLGFAAKIRIQADEIAECYHRMLHDLRAETRDLGVAVHASRYSSFRARVSGHRRGMLEQQLAKCDELVDHVVWLVEYVRINLTAFRKICKKIDKQLGSSMSQQMPQRLMKRRFYQDCAMEGNGTLRDLYDTLVAMGVETVAKLSSDRASAHALMPWGGMLRRASTQGPVFRPEPFVHITSDVLYAETSTHTAPQPASFEDIEHHLQAFAHMSSRPNSMERPREGAGGAGREAGAVGSGGREAGVVGAEDRALAPVRCGQQCPVM